MGTGQADRRYFRLYPRYRLVRAPAGCLQADAECEERRYRGGAGGDHRLLWYDPLRRHGFRDPDRQDYSGGANTDLVCDAINTAMRELFLQIVYGRTQSAFSEDGLAVGASLEDLGKGLRSQVGTMFGTREKGPRYLEMAEGYCSKLALNDKDEIIGYEFISLGKMMDAVKKGVDANEALKNATGHYGQWDNAAKYIDPRQE